MNDNEKVKKAIWAINFKYWTNEMAKLNVKDMCFSLFRHISEHGNTNAKYSPGNPAVTSL